MSPLKYVVGAVLVLSLATVIEAAHGNASPQLVQETSADQRIRELERKVQQLETSLKELQNAEERIVKVEATVKLMNEALAAMKHDSDDVRKRQQEDGIVLDQHEKSIRGIQATLKTCCGPKKNKTGTENARP